MVTGGGGGCPGQGVKVSLGLMQSAQSIGGTLSSVLFSPSQVASAWAFEVVIFLFPGQKTSFISSPGATPMSE